MKYVKLKLKLLWQMMNKIEFYYEKLDDDSHEVTLNAMFFPNSNEKFNALETAIA